MNSVIVIYWFSTIPACSFLFGNKGNNIMLEVSKNHSPFLKFNYAFKFLLEKRGSKSKERNYKEIKRGVETSITSTSKRC